MEGNLSASGRGAITKRTFRSAVMPTFLQKTEKGPIHSIKDEEAGKTGRRSVSFPFGNKRKKLQMIPVAQIFGGASLIQAFSDETCFLLFFCALSRLDSLLDKHAK